jgi:creatinine amidohydrolase
MNKKSLFVVIPIICTFVVGVLVASIICANAQERLIGKGYSIFDGTMVDMKWPEVDQAAKDGAIVLFPTGVIEEHGRHLSLGVDTYGAYLKCRLTKQYLEGKGIKTVIAPPFYWGVNNATGSFPGSFSSRPETVSAVIYDALASLARWGFSQVFFINHHADHVHQAAIIEGVRKARIDTGIRAYYILGAVDARRFGVAEKDYANDYPFHILLQPSGPSPASPPKYLDFHAGAWETAMMAYYFPTLADLDLARKMPDTKFGVAELLQFRKGWEETRKLAPDGHGGNPAAFDPLAAKKDYENSSNVLADLIESFLKGTYVRPEVK